MNTRQTQRLSTSLEVERTYALTTGVPLPGLAGLDGVEEVAPPRTTQLDAVYWDTADLRLAVRGIRLRRRTGGADAGWHVKLPGPDGTTEVHAPLGRAGSAPADLRALLLSVTRGAPLVPRVRIRTRRVETDLRGEDGRVLAIVADDDVTADILEPEPAPAGQVATGHDGVEQASVPPTLPVTGDVPTAGPGSAGHDDEGGEEAGLAVRNGSIALLPAPALVVTGTDGDPAAVQDASALNGSRPTPAITHEPMRWREVEVELAEGSVSVLDTVERRLLAGGATPATHPSKMGRVVAALLPSVDPGAASGRGPKRERRARAPRPRADEVITAYVREQVDALVALDPRVRRDEEDAVHAMRVATRRLRSALTTYRPLLDATVTDPLRGELAWLAAELGEMRDREVLRERLLARVAELPPELVLGPVVARIDSTLTGDHAVARRRVLKELTSARYLTLLDALYDLAAAPPLMARAGRRADKVLGPRVVHAHARIGAALHRASTATQDSARTQALHDARKAGKRLRYATELFTPVMTADAERTVKRAKELQTLLGEVQDSTVARDTLRTMALAAQGAGESAFTYGLMYAHEQARAAEELTGLGSAWEKLALPKAIRRLA